MMLCSHCKKEEETITIAGKTYCANCSTLLSDKKSEAASTPKHKVPTLEQTDNEIRTAENKSKPPVVDPVIKEILKDTKIADVDKDDLEGSAILLDILSENAKEELDDKTLEEDKKLAEASEDVIDILGKSEKSTTEVRPTVPTQTQATKQPPMQTSAVPPQARKQHPPHSNSNNKIMNDIIPANIGKRKDYQNKKHKETIKNAEQEIKGELENLGRIVSSESGYTKEYDLMIMAISLTAVTLVILAIFMTFK